MPGIVGLGKACEICRQEMPEESQRLAALRDRLKDGLLAALDGIHINGSLEHRLPNNLNVSFPGIDLGHTAGGFERHCAFLGLGLHLRDS